MAATEDGELTGLARLLAVARRHPQAGLLHHSDRGTEFTCERYQAALRELGVEVSMSRTGNCWENAAMEAFFATLAKECINRATYQTRQEARSSIFEYIECFYNPIRLHSTLQYMSPVTYEQAHVPENELVVYKPWYPSSMPLFFRAKSKATARGDDARFWSYIRRLFPEPGEEEQQEVLTSVQQILSQARLREETRETVQDTVKLFSEQFGIAFDLTLQVAEARNDSVAQPLSPPQETSTLVSAQVAKQFFERMFEQHGYTGWQVVLSVHASSPYADSAARQLVLPVTEQSIKQILSIYEHAVLDHVESTVAGEQSRLGLLGIGLPGYTLSREGSALYQQRQTARRAGKPFDDSTIWAGTLGILLACRVIDTARSFLWVYSCLRHVFFLYRRLIPIRGLKRNIEMRETHHRSQTCIVVSQFIETPAEFVTQEIERGEDPVVKVLLAEFFPPMLNGVDLWTVGWLENQANMGGNDQFARAMPPGLIDLHDDEIVRERLADRFEKEIHHGSVGAREDQGRKLAKRRSHCREDIHRLAHHL
jgi:hypothetical protein